MRIRYTPFCASKKGGIEFPPMPFRKQMAVLTLTVLLTSAGVADTSVCRMLCAAHLALGGSSTPVATRHLHHSASSQKDSSVHGHANYCAGNQQSMVSCGGSVLEAPRCTRYQQLARLSDVSRVTVPEKGSGNDAHALLPAVRIEEISEGAPSPSSSPPDFYVAFGSTPISLRI
jgi:hypothetical protein